MDKSQPLLLFVITNISFAVYNIITVYIVYSCAEQFYLCAQAPQISYQYFMYFHV